MEVREEYCAWCGKRGPIAELYPLVAWHEETRQYHCRRELPCYVRRVWKARSILVLFRDDD